MIERIRRLYKIREERLLPVPWCEDFSFKLNEIFTRLRIAGKDKTRGEMKEEITNMTAIFKSHEECEEPPRTVLIEGDPGMGKTTYCQKLAYDWATSREHWDESFPMITLLLLLRCHDIKSNLWEAIDEQLLPDDVDEECKENLFKFIRENQSSVLFVLDGLDEADHGKINMFINLPQSKELPKCLFVFTSRHESGIKMRRYCDNLWEIVGFTEEDAEHFIYKYFRNMKYLADRLRREIRSRSDLRQLISNPLNTALLCILCEDFEEAFPESRTQLYIEIVKCVLRRYEAKKGFSSDEEDLIEVYEEELRSLGCIALQSLLKGELYIEESKANGNNFNAVKKFGFLSTQSGRSRRKPCFRYCFLHKSIQEFFAGFYLALKNVREEDEAEITIIDERFLGELGQVFLYICGIVAIQSEENAKRLLRKITAHVNMISAEVKKVRRTIELAFCLIEECGKCKKSLQSQLLHEFGAHLQLKAYTFEEIPRLDFFLKSLSSNTSLTYLDLSSNKICDSGAASLSQALSVNTSLTYLDLSSNEIYNSGAASLSQALSVNTSLTYLDLSSNRILDSGAASLSQALSVNTSLTYLDLSSNEIYNSGAASLSQALSVNTSLTYLDLISNRILDSGAASLSQALLVNTSLIHLSLGSQIIGNCGAASLFGALSVNTALTYLDLHSNMIGDSGAASLSQALSVNTSLTGMKLCYNVIGDSGAASLSQALLVNTTLTVLNLDCNQIGDSGAASLSQALSVNTSLTHLGLRNRMIGGPGYASLSQALSVNTSLTHLGLRNTMIGDIFDCDSAAFLSQALLVNTTLTHLDLHSFVIAGNSVASLSQALSVNTSLTHLNLESTNFGGSAATSLFKALSVNISLTDLNLSYSQIDNSSSASLSQALLVNTSLTRLNLGHNHIGDSGAASLSQALSVNTTLTRLNLGHNHIGDSGAAFLSQALSINTTLTYLNLEANFIGAYGAASLSQALLANSSSLDL